MFLYVFVYCVGDGLARPADTNQRPANLNLRRLLHKCRGGRPCPPVDIIPSANPHQRPVYITQTFGVFVVYGTDAQCAPLHGTITGVKSDLRRAEGVTPYNLRNSILFRRDRRDGQARPLQMGFNLQGFRVFLMRWSSEVLLRRASRKINISSPMRTRCTNTETALCNPRQHLL